VYVTDVPAQTGFADAEIDTLTGSMLLTIVVIGLDKAGLPVWQATVEVSKQVITLPLEGLKVYVALVAALTFTPPTFH
jgi:hypothetical protein